jgi:hypothetical protein
MKKKFVRPLFIKVCSRPWRLLSRLPSRASRLGKRNVCQAHSPSSNELDNVINLAERDCTFADEGSRPRRYWSISNSSAMGMGCGLGDHISSVSDLSQCPSLELEDSEGSYYTEAGQADVYHSKDLPGHLPIEFLGVMQKVVAEMLTRHCKGEGGGLHNGQYGCRKGQSAIDAVHMLVTDVQKAWAQQEVAGALCMDIEATFPSVAWDCLARKMRKTGIDECLVMWMLDFMIERWVRMVVDGQEGQELAVTTGLSQGSPALPLLFAIYMHDLHEYVERWFPGLRASLS